FPESFFTSEPPSDSPCNGNKSPQMWRQSGEVERLKQKLAETEREVTEREHDLRTLERLREMERTEAQIWISALKLKEREGKEARRSADSQAAAQSVSSSPQDWTPTSLVAEADRRNRQQGSALMPVLEEDEENSDWAGVEEGDA
ncbi:hypothetical protein XENORESO_013961, partial [Xenotaenia resolanae]